ncbi:MAG TPA: hypothetical protein VFW98_11090 [Gemmatimonadaceae bacterium]|nr:hypothetical protein [Gemmatimonadaceae bacterium]
MRRTRTLRDDSAAEQLVVNVDGGPPDTDYTLILDGRSGGRVHVREWNSQNRGGAAREYDTSAEEIYARLERAAADRRRISTDLLRIRAWLDAPAR